VRPGNVKALIHQARTTLIAEREARETPREVIREQLATAQGGAGRCAAIWGAASRAARTAWRRPTSGARWRSRSRHAEPRAQGGGPRQRVGGRRREHGRLGDRWLHGEGRGGRAPRWRRRRRGRRDRAPRGSQVVHSLEDVEDIEAWRAEMRRQARADKIKVRTGFNDGIV
jgi:hypothetical protein